MTGEILKRRREDLNLNLKEIASLLKVRADYLEAIENNVFDRLPVEVYTKGYIRCYAQYLNVDAEPIITYYKDHLARPQHATIIPVASSRKRSALPLFISLFLVAGIIAGFFIIKTDQGARRQPLPDKVAPQPAENLAQTTPAGNTITAEKVQESVPAQSTPAVIPLAPQEKREHSLEFRAVETTWIYLKAGTDKPEEVLLQPGDAKIWKFYEQALIKIGNAGGVKIKYDGRDLNTSGKSGQVLILNLPENQ